jgi:hypothetical protein
VFAARVRCQVAADRRRFADAAVFRNLLRCPKRKVWVDPELGRKYCEFHKPTGSRILTPREIVTKMLADPRCDIKVAL